MQTPIKSVTFCVYDREGACGGPYAWAVEIVKALIRSRRRVKVLILCPGGFEKSAIGAVCKKEGSEVSTLDTDQALFLEDQVEWILGEWRQSPSSVFIANLVLPALYASGWIRRAGGRTVGVIHSNPDHDVFYADFINHFVHGASELVLDAIVPVSDHIAAKVCDFQGSGIEVATIPCGTSVPKNSTIAPDDCLRLIFCGRLVQEAKRIRELVEAFLRACSMGGVNATICGDGEERDWVIERLAGQEGVSYIGKIAPDRVHDLMLQHHVVVLLSDYEGLPMAVIEGMACGLVPVCLDEPSGAREIIRHELNGLLVEDRGPSFLNAIDRLRSPVLWTRLSSMAKETVESRYAHPVVFQRWIDLLDQLDTGLPPKPNRIPKRIHLNGVRKQGAFSGYPANRPTSIELYQRQFNSLWQAIRLTLRPRSRFRAIRKRFQDHG